MVYVNLYLSIAFSVTIKHGICDIMTKNVLRGERMGKVPSFEEAAELLSEYNKEEFHIRHSNIVSGVLRYFAKEHDPDNEEYWAAVGLLHDLDFELYPDEHCKKSVQIMSALGYDAGFIDAVASHGYGLAQNDVKPQRYMEKVLYATDELTGLIGAAALMRPSKSVSDMETKSVMKKYKSPAFAAGVSREVIQQGADMLGLSLQELIGQTLLAMRSLPDEMGV